MCADRLLWTTWLITTIYDVRFTSDSILERSCKALHLGVMVGFAEMGTSFDPHKQIESVYRAMSLFLCVSRLLLTLQYGVVAYQIRKYAHGLGPMMVTAAFHLVAACVYFGISFRYSQNRNSRIYVAWYVLGLVEMALHLGFSQLSDVLTFLGTHLGERLNLLTLIVMGEGKSARRGNGRLGQWLTTCRSAQASSSSPRTLRSWSRIRISKIPPSCSGVSGAPTHCRSPFPPPC